MAEPSPPSRKHAGCTDKARSSLTRFADAMARKKIVFSERSSHPRPDKGSKGGFRKAIQNHPQIPCRDQQTPWRAQPPCPSKKTADEGLSAQCQAINKLVAARYSCNIPPQGQY